MYLIDPNRTAAAHSCAVPAIGLTGSALPFALNSAVGEATGSTPRTRRLSAFLSCGNDTLIP
jgi:hypothetical protein